LANRFAARAQVHPLSPSAIRIGIALLPTVEPPPGACGFVRFGFDNDVIGIHTHSDANKTKPDQSLLDILGLRSPMKRQPFEPDTDRASLGLERFLGLTAGTLARAIGWSLTQRTARFGATPGTYAVIAWLIQLPDSTQGELSRLIGIEQPTMASTLNRMERGGLIERRPDPGHGRKSRVKLTALGEKIGDVMRAAAREVEAVACNGMSAAEVTEFFRLAGRMITNLSTERRRKQ
jgi:DNA-binding MarR family transcriptional regulator